MKTLATEQNTNDIFLNDKGYLAITEDKAAISNIALNNVRTLQGEDIFNLQNGIPYFDVLFNDRPNFDLFKKFVTDQILKIAGVIAVKDFELNLDGNTLKYALTIQLNNGAEVALNG